MRDVTHYPIYKKPHSATKRHYVITKYSKAHTAKYLESLPDRECYFVGTVSAGAWLQEYYTQSAPRLQKLKKRKDAQKIAPATWAALARSAIKSAQHIYSDPGYTQCWISDSMGIWISGDVLAIYSHNSDIVILYK